MSGVAIRSRVRESAEPQPARSPVPPVPPVGPAERLELLCDPGTFSPVRSRVSSSQRGERNAPGDGVLAGAGRIGGRPVFCYSQDPRFMGGSLGAAHADSIVRIMHLAGQAGAPVIGFVESGGARLQEGHAALAGYGRIFRASVELSGKVPQISIVTGVSAGGGAYSPALTDFVVMTESARMFLTGPGIVREALGEEISAEDLGGPSVHSRNGVCQLVAKDEPEAIATVRDLLDLLQSAGPAEWPADTHATAAVVPAPAPDPGAIVPAEARKIYDVREVIAALADNGHLLELSRDWARNMVTALARIDGRTVGVVANQPRWLGGVIDAVAAEKAACFVDSCDRFGIPLLALVDTPGFMPGSGQERSGVIRHGASLLRAFASAQVPKMTVVMRKGYGGAVITMNSKDLGADLVFAWPGAEIGIMAAPQAVGIVQRREIAAADDSAIARRDLASAYADEHLNADAAADAGFVDEVIDSADTRDRIAWALEVLERR